MKVSLNQTERVVGRSKLKQQVEAAYKCTAHRRLIPALRVGRVAEKPAEKKTMFMLLQQLLLQREAALKYFQGLEIPPIFVVAFFV